MARTKGALNKPKRKPTELITINLEKQIENAPICKDSNMGWVKWGEKNLYPFDLINLYNTSVTHRSCIDFATNAFVGQGVDLDAMQLKDGDLQNPNYYTDWNTFMRAIAFDYFLYGGFCFQIIKNRDNKTYSFFNQQFETVRFEPYDSDGVINNAYVCSDWSAYAMNTPVKLPTFGFQSEKTIKMGQVYLYFYKNPNPVNKYYPLPTYSSGIKAIQAEAQYLNFDIKTIMNGFNPSGILSLPPIETEQEKQAIIDNIQCMFQGTDNSNSMMIRFSNGLGDDSDQIKFEPFSTPSNIDIYDQANIRTINRICAAHKIPSKALIGYQLESNGFSSEGDALKMAYKLYSINVIDSARKTILSAINNALNMNGVETELVLKDLNFDLEDNQTVETKSAPTNVKQVDEDDATEREDDTV